MLRYDIKIEADYINANNDFEWYNSDVDHIENIINASKGEYKENPALGCAINTYINSTTADGEIERNITMQLQSDLYDCSNPIVIKDNLGGISINPNIEL